MVAKCSEKEAVPSRNWFVSDRFENGKSQLLIICVRSTIDSASRRLDDATLHADVIPESALTIFI